MKRLEVLEQVDNSCDIKACDVHDDEKKMVEKYLIIYEEYDEGSNEFEED